MTLPVTYTIGRDAAAEIRIPDSERTVSGVHAEVTLATDGRLYLTDRNSTNGTRIYRGGDWRPLRQAFVEWDEPIQLGAYQTSLRQLLADRLPRPQWEAAIRTVPSIPQEEAERVRKPRRNPLTGEIIED